MTTQVPFFSIIIPTYNRAKQLRSAIASVLAQQFKDYEIVIVDDGSTDNTREVIKDLLPDNLSIKYFYKTNEERSIARNYGIQRALGRYINFLDSDDVLYPTHFSVAHDLLSKNNFPEVGHLGFRTIDSEGREISVTRNLDTTFREKLISENFLHGNAIFIRKDIAEQVNFIPSALAFLSEDWYVWLRLAARYNFYFDNTITSAVIVHPERSLLNIDPVKLIANTNILVNNLKKDVPFMKAYRHMANYHFANHYTFLTLILSTAKARKWDTLRYLVIAIQHDPKVIFRKRFLASIKHLITP